MGKKHNDKLARIAKEMADHYQNGVRYLEADLAEREYKGGPDWGGVIPCVKKTIKVETQKVSMLIQIAAAKDPVAEARKHLGGDNNDLIVEFFKKGRIEP